METFFSLNFVVLFFLHICGIIFSFIFVVNSQPESFLSRATSVWGHSWHLCVLLIKTINSYWKHFSTRLFVHWCRLLFIVKIFLMVSSWWGEKYKWLRCQASLWTNIGKSANRIVRGGSRGAQGGQGEALGLGEGRVVRKLEHKHCQRRGRRKTEGKHRGRWFLGDFLLTKLFSLYIYFPSNVY